MTCRDCIHYDVCKELRHGDISDCNTEDCGGFFKSKDNFVEVVRCNDCKYFTERDRLIELIRKSNLVDVWNYATDDFKYPNPIKSLADYLLENGVIVPPCKVGDTVYDVFPLGQKIIPRKVTGIRAGISTEGTYLSVEQIGKTVFLTLEEAERALKGSECNG